MMNLMMVMTVVTTVRIFTNRVVLTVDGQGGKYFLNLILRKIEFMYNLIKR